MAGAFVGRGRASSHEKVGHGALCTLGPLSRALQARETRESLRAFICKAEEEDNRILSGKHASAVQRAEGLQSESRGPLRWLLQCLGEGGWREDSEQ